MSRDILQTDFSQIHSCSSEYGKKMIAECIQALIVVLHEAGLLQVEISKQFRISRCCVQNTIKKFKETGPYDEKKAVWTPSQD